MPLRPERLDILDAETLDSDELEEVRFAERRTDHSRRRGIASALVLFGARADRCKPACSLRCRGPQAGRAHHDVRLPATVSRPEPAPLKPLEEHEPEPNVAPTPEGAAAGDADDAPEGGRRRRRPRHWTIQGPRSGWRRVRVTGLRASGPT